MKATGKPAVWPVRHRTGHFIWIEGEAKPHHFFLFARGRVHVPQEPVAARLHITASDRYVLYVNGHYVGRGPARSDPTRKSFDTYAVGALLHVGANVIAVRAYHYGPDSRDIGWTPSQGSAYAHGERAGLWVELEVDLADGSRQVSGTSGDWRVRPARGWDRSAREISYLIGTSEIYDAAADPVDWMEPGFDDAVWEPAWVIPQRGLVWVLLEERETPMLVERQVWPQGIVAQGEVIDLGAPHQTDIARMLDAEVHRPLEHASIHNIDAALQPDSEAAEFRGCFAGYLEGRRVPFAIFDFGRQLDGYPRIQLTAPQGALIDITHGQHLQGGRVHNGMAYGDRYITREGTQTWELSDYRQFRYLHVAVRSAYAPVQIHGVSVNEYAYPDRKPRATFECSDPTLTRLWDACVNTTYIGLKDDLEHEFYRERVVFRLGDASAILHHVLSTWGDIELADRFLRQATLSTRGDGLIRAAYPPGSSQTHMWMPFPLQWSTKVRDHYLFTGKAWVLEELYRTVPRVMDWFEPHRDAMGLLRDLPYWNWQDWAPVDLRGANTITNALYVKSLEDAAWLADRVGTAKDAETWRRIAGEVRQAIRQVLWDDAKGVYADSHHNGSLTGVVSELANAYAVLYGVATADQIPRIGSYLAAEHPDTVRSTPAFMGFVVDGMMIAGAAAPAMKLMRDRYGPMLDWEDVPTIWEGWGPFTGSQAIDSEATVSLQDQPRVAGQRSLVHTSGCCVGYALSKRVLGVMPTGPGFATCEIRPCPGDLEWARGAYPTPHGDVHVEWRADKGSIELSVDLPHGVAATVVLDRPTSNRQIIERDGETVRLDVSRLPPDLEVTPDQVRIGPLTGSQVIALR